MSEFTLKYAGRRVTLTAELGVHESELGDVYLEIEVTPRHDGLSVDVFDRHRASGCQLVGEIQIERQDDGTITATLTNELQLHENQDGPSTLLYNPNKRPYETHADEWRKREEDPAA